MGELYLNKASFKTEIVAWSSQLRMRWQAGHSEEGTRIVILPQAQAGGGGGVDRQVFVISVLQGQNSHLSWEVPRSWVCVQKRMADSGAKVQIFSKGRGLTFMCNTLQGGLIFQVLTHQTKKGGRWRALSAACLICALTTDPEQGQPRAATQLQCH